MRKSLSYLDSLSVTFHKQSLTSMFTVHDSSTIWPDCGKKANDGCSTNLSVTSIRKAT